MRFSALLGLALASISYDHIQSQMAPMSLTLARRPGGFIGSGGAAGHARTMRHTGAGAGGMHHRWKKLRASGRR